MAQAVSLQFITAEARVRFQASPCKICGGQSGTGIGFYLTQGQGFIQVLWLSSQYNYTNSTYSFTHLTLILRYLSNLWHH
jgi:hypothetical protein